MVETEKMLRNSEWLMFCLHNLYFFPMDGKTHVDIPVEEFKSCKLSIFPDEIKSASIHSFPTYINEEPHACYLLANLDLDYEREEVYVAVRVSLKDRSVEKGKLEMSTEMSLFLDRGEEGKYRLLDALRKNPLNPVIIQPGFL